MNLKNHRDLNQMDMSENEKNWKQKVEENPNKYLLSVKNTWKI